MTKKRTPVKGIRLNKYISESGYCSRRQADEYIAQGRVTINDVDAKIGWQVVDGDQVAVDGERIGTMKRRLYIAFNKPVGITCTTDPKDKTNIVSFINHPTRIFNIGRLDKLSEGLIFMTNDGDVVNKILRAGNNHEKEYIVTVDKPINEGFIAKMSSGVHIGARTMTDPCKVIRETDTRFRIILTQGLNRQIRRMCESLNYNVVMLKRVRIMNINLGNLEVGSWRYFTPSEINDISEIISDSVGTKEASKKSRPAVIKSVTETADNVTIETHTTRGKGTPKSSYKNYRGEPVAKTYNDYYQDDEIDSDQPKQKLSRRQAAKSAGKTVKISTKNSDDGSEKNSEKRSEKPHTQRYPSKVTGKTDSKSYAKKSEKDSAKTGSKPYGKATDKTSTASGKTFNRVPGRDAEKNYDKSTAKAGKKSYTKSSGTNYDDSIERSSDKAYIKKSGKSYNSSAVKSTRKSGAKNFKK